MRLKNETYDLGKWLVLIFLPALAVLMGGFGDLYDWSYSSIIVGTINLITIFFGSLLQISSVGYYSKNDWWEDDNNGPKYS